MNFDKDRAVRLERHKYFAHSKGKKHPGSCCLGFIRPNFPAQRRCLARGVGSPDPASILLGVKNRSLPAPELAAQPLGVNFSGLMFHAKI
jgi:hypothetical protein